MRSASLRVDVHTPGPESTGWIELTLRPDAEQAA